MVKKDQRVANFGNIEMMNEETSQDRENFGRNQRCYRMTKGRKRRFSVARHDK